jgi:serine/threonine-protein kinase HipA
MIQVWTDKAASGTLARYSVRGSSFAYGNVQPERAVSVTMPVRVPSWNSDFGLVPIFDMNLPEGALRERLRMAFAKATGKLDDLDLLSVVGRSLLGRVRFTGPEETLDAELPFQSVDEILAGGRGGDLYRFLIDRFAAYSGISGVQPKVLLRDEGDHAAKDHGGGRVPPSYRGATHIVKFWEAREFPQLAANEHFCLKVAQACGLQVPRHRLSDDGLALVVDRFDLKPDGTYLGMEDFCVLNGKPTDRKYSGSYETSVMQRFRQFGAVETMTRDLEDMFTLIALNCAVRNGDAHLKNFAIVYENVFAAARLAPVYDIVTTTAYLERDRMALTLEGSTEWPSAKRLQSLGETRALCSPSTVRRIFDRIADAISAVVPEVEAYARDHAEFAEIGKRMLEQWEIGRQSLRR